MVVHPLESGVRPRHSFGAAVPSIVVHGAIILLVVQLTAHASLPSFHIATGIPTDVSPALVTGNDFAPDPLTNHSNFAIGGQGSVPNGQPNNPFTEAEVDRQVQVLASVTPRYPDVLRDAHVQGTVLAQFVVDTTGRVEPGSFHALRSDNDLFTEAVRATVGAMHFRPAEAGGRRVRQLVQQPFSFALR